MKHKLTDFERYVIIDKGTEIPFSGEYLYNTQKGIYLCKQCGQPVYRSEDKFESSCGWPSFDAEIADAVRRTPDADGIRTEITCSKCGAHLGHVFTGEGYTAKDTRHCVNSVSMIFIPNEQAEQAGRRKKETAVFGGGCFWGVDYMFNKEHGVLDVETGYMGGTVRHPSYEEVCTGNTGHAEVVKIIFDPAMVSYERLARLFFETHDPEQADGQGPDIGDQYRSVIFYATEKQKDTAGKLIEELKSKGYNVVTEVCEADTFWKAEERHQDYYGKQGQRPYCHRYTKRF